MKKNIEYINDWRSFGEGRRKETDGESKLKRGIGIRFYRTL